MEERAFAPRLVTLPKVPKPKPEPVRETYTVAEVAARLGISDDTVRRWMRADAADGGRRVPGGRCHGTMYVILAAVFDRALVDGEEPARHEAAPPLDLAAIRAHLAELARLLDAAG